MSQRLPASRPVSRSPTDGQRITLPPVQLRDDPQQQGGRPGERHQNEPESRGSFTQQHAHPSPQHSHPPPSGEDWRNAPLSRDLGVHSMLNPTEESTPSIPRPLSTTESPLSTIGPPPPFGASPSAAPVHSFPGQHASPSTPVAGSAPGFHLNYPRDRPILTPRSPRAVSRNHRPGPATIDAHQTPFLSGNRPSRAYTAEPGPSATSDIPPMPAQAGAGGQQYNYSPQASNPLGPGRRPSGGMQAPPLSQSASPSISASSHNPPSSQTSPASFYHKGGPGGPPQPSGPYYPGTTFASTMQQGGGSMQFAGPSGGGGGEGLYNAPTPQTHGSSFQSSSPGSSMQTSGSENIKLMTMNTPEGSYQVPVDIHQASRLADEKRARNAGASARFRQRRKEKEKEAGASIEKLQQQTRELERKVREVEQERDFYRSERNRFRDVVYRTPETRHLAQGPPSPQTTSGRGGASGQFPASLTMGHIGGPPPPPPSMNFQNPTPGSGSGPERGQERGPEGGERAPRRRRTDARGDFTSLPYAHPASTLPPVQAGYSPGTVAQSLPPLRMETSSIPPNTSAPSASPSTTVPPPPPNYSPYPRGPYERGWSGDNNSRPGDSSSRR